MAYKTFANGFPLPASDLNNYLMNQSVIVFANSTARDAALTSPVEGMTTYLEDTNQVSVWTGAAWELITSEAVPLSTVTTAGDLIVADGASSVSRLGIGADGTVLSSDGTNVSWVAAASGGLVEITSGSFSGSTVSITSIDQSYKYLFLNAIGVQTADGSAVKGTFNSDSGSNYSSGATNFPVADSLGTRDSTSLRNCHNYIYNYSSGSNGVFVLSNNLIRNYSAGTGLYSASSSGSWSGNTATSIQMFTTTASTFTSGTWALYGGN